MRYLFFIFIGCTCCHGRLSQSDQVARPKSFFLWENATVYFLMTDRFYNADSSNDHSYGRQNDGAKLRGFEGGDIKGIIKKLRDGYFDQLGINVIWTTPLFEQVHGSMDEGYGVNYAYHGYWIRDWTNLDQNFGSYEDFAELVQTAHAHGIRILMDIVINHTGPVTAVDSPWPDTWVRTSPKCTYKDYETNVNCTLSLNPDIRTESNQDVALPEFLIEKWKREARYEKEIEKLDSFFGRTGYPRAPRYYIIKWLCDYIRALGIDGFRVDTAKHTEISVWDDLFKEATLAFQDWKKSHPEETLDDQDFFMVGEVYGYDIHNEKIYNYGDSSVDFFDHGFKSLINFRYKSDAGLPYDELFSSYSDLLQGPLKNKTVLNYLSSHDDMNPYDQRRENVLDAATRLLLSPGQAQIYYGDETARSLIIEGTTGDATLRSMMNWIDLDGNKKLQDITTREVFDHWCKLGKFRNQHPAVGAGIHKKLKDVPYTFERVLRSPGIGDSVLVVLGVPDTIVQVQDVFPEHSQIMDYYSGNTYEVNHGIIYPEKRVNILLLGRVPE